MDLSTIIMQLKKGKDEKIFCILFETFYPLAYKTAYLITGDEHLARDAVQEAFIKVFSFLHQLMEPQKFRSWLMTVVSNKAIDIIKSRKKLLFTEDMEKVISLVGLRDLDINPTAETVIRQEAKKLLLNVVMALPTHYRQVLIMKYYCDFKEDEIARELAIKEGTIKSRLNRARLILKHKLTAVTEAEPAGDVKGGTRV